MGIKNLRSGNPSSWLPKKLKSVMLDVFINSERVPKATLNKK